MNAPTVEAQAPQRQNAEIKNAKSTASFLRAKLQQSLAFATLVVLLIFFSFANSAFFTWSNISGILLSTAVIGILADKDAQGIIEALAPRVTRFHVTQPRSDRAVAVDDLADQIAGWVGDERTFRFDDVSDALGSARDWAGEGTQRAVIVTGSIALVGETIVLADAGEWMTS